ncbi:hypothetical protein FNH05_04620 [Amycolatopsis rhizosphaerae]|uniref:Uncharacterized protein n=1 Tax=Amycolatopsis rhizosphaerae TaxID=2053003 RepID=A0A558DHI5_9PSEU|nr:hypothetical protein FNH05_04620 [Amycolatopsis rhizosphaerae]
MSPATSVPASWMIDTRESVWLPRPSAMPSTPPRLASSAVGEIQLRTRPGVPSAPTQPKPRPVP